MNIDIGVDIVNSKNSDMFKEWKYTYQSIKKIDYKKIWIFYGFTNLKLLHKRKIHKNISDIIISDKSVIEKLELYKSILIDIYNYVDNTDEDIKKYGDLFTPMVLVDEMLDKLPKNIWNNPNLKWFDPCNGLGNFIISIIHRLMLGLSNFIIDENKRYRYIIENMIFISEIRDINIFNFLMLLNPKEEYNLNYYKGDFLSKDFDNKLKEWNIENFDIIISSPPSQKNNSSNNFSLPIYHLFVEKSIKLSKKVLMLTPSKWFMSGKGLNNYRSDMIYNQNIISITHFENNKRKIRGGLSYFYIDNNLKKKDYLLFNGKKIYPKKIGYIFPNNIYYDIINKVIEKKHSFKNIVMYSNFFGKIHNDKKTLRNGSDLFLEKQKDTDYKCYVRKKEGFIRYVDYELVDNNYGIQKYKIFTASASDPKFKDKLSTTFIGYPNEICTETYLVILCENEIYAKNVISFLKTNFFKFLFGICLIDQHVSKEIFRYVPLMDFNENWNDDKLFSYFNLNKNEINTILKYNI